MAATFGDPLTLSKHEISSKITSELAPVLVSCARGSKTEYVTTAVHGEGINIIDLTSLQTEGATLLGPNSSFACPPVTRVIQKNQMERIRQTYAVTNSSSAKSSAKRSQTLSLWLSNEGLASLQQDHTVELTSPAVALSALDSFLDKVILISPEGIITTYDSNLQNTEQEASPSGAQKLLWSFVFESAHCNFALGNPLSASSKAIVITILRRKKEIYLRVCSVGDRVAAIGETLVQTPAHDIISASCNSDGCLSLLEKDGSLFNFNVQLRKDEVALLPQETLALQGMNIPNMSISCLGSTHVLVVGFDKVNADIVLLIWDVQYGVLLAEKKILKPNAFSVISPDLLQLSLTSCDTTQTLLSISSTKSGSKKNASAIGLKAIVMIIPHSIPASSSLAGALGRATSSEKWLAPVPLDTASGSNSRDDGREAMLASVTDAIESGQADVADRIFFEWEAEQRALVKALAKEEAKRQMAALAPKKAVNGHAGASDSDEAHHDPKISVKHVPNQIEWGHSFLTQLMRVVLQTDSTRGDTPAFFSKIPSYFLERKLISDGIVEGGVLKALQDRGDWISVRWALRNTMDISEDHLAGLLLHSVRLYRTRSKSKEENAMEVDESASVNAKIPFPLPQVLGHIIGYPSSAPPLRLAIKQQFSQMEDVVILLETINSWITESAKKSLIVKLGDVNEELKRGEQTNHERAVEKDGLPRLDLLVSFVSSLLDAVLLDLLQYRRAHRPLRIMSKRLAPYVPYLEGLDRLRGPLEPFVTAERRSRRPWDDHKKGPKGRDRKDDNYALNANLYQVEEFFV